MRYYTSNSTPHPQREHYVRVPIVLNPESIEVLGDQHTVDAVRGSFNEREKIISPSGKVYTTPPFSLHASSAVRRSTLTGG
jgi:hypothetical protein